MLSELGIERLIVTGMPENEAGIGLIEAAGYRPVGRIGAIRLGPARVPVRRPLAGHLGRARRFRATGG